VEVVTPRGHTLRAGSATQPPTPSVCERKVQRGDNVHSPLLYWTPIGSCPCFGAISPAAAGGRREPPPQQASQTKAERPARFTELSGAACFVPLRSLWPHSPGHRRYQLPPPL